MHRPKTSLSLLALSVFTGFTTLVSSAPAHAQPQPEVSAVPAPVQPVPPTPQVGQQAEGQAKPPEKAPIFLGFDFAIGSPQGDFAKNVDTSLGFDLHGGYQLSSILGIRLDIAHLIYGSESWKAMNPSFPGVSFEMQTENTMTFFGLGPQVVGRLGPLRPFAQASIGFTYLATSTELRGNNKEENVTEDTNYKDFAFAYGGGAGLGIDLPWPGVLVSVGAFYQAGGNADYVLKGGLRNNGDGSVSPQVVSSQTGVLRYQVGLALGW